MIQIDNPKEKDKEVKSITKQYYLLIFQKNAENYLIIEFMKKMSIRDLSFYRIKTLQPEGRGLVDFLL